MGIEHFRHGKLRFVGDQVTTTTHRSCVYCGKLFPHMDLLQHLYSCPKRTFSIKVSDVANCVYCYEIFPMCTVIHHTVNCETRKTITNLNYNQRTVEIAIKVFRFENDYKYENNVKHIIWSNDMIDLALAFYIVIDHIREHRQMPDSSHYALIFPKYITDLFYNQVHQLYVEQIVIIPECLTKVNEVITRPTEWWESKIKTERRSVPNNWWLSQTDVVPIEFRQPSRQEDGFYLRQWIVVNPERFVTDLYT